MKSLLCLIAMVCSGGALGGDTTFLPLNERPGCIGPENSGTTSCDPPVEEIFCSADCVSTGDFCKRAGTENSIAFFEDEVMSSGISTLIEVYSPCNPAFAANQCRPSTLVDTINCYKSTDCHCKLIGGNRICVYGQETVFYLIVYRPRTTGPGCPVDAPPPGIGE